MVPEQGEMEEQRILASTRNPNLFDWNVDGTSDHVGIVEKTEGSTVYTVEGNSSDAVNQRSYDINNGTIMGYGIL